MIGHLPHMAAALADTAAALAWSIAKATFVAVLFVAACGYLVWRGRRS